MRDSDCGSGICVCDPHTVAGRCTASNCRVDADCGANSLCATSGQICSYETFQCTSTEDECLSNLDCGTNGATCVFQDGRRTCNGAVCGRPFLVADAPRWAEIEPRADWLEASDLPDPSGLSPLARAELAAHWSRLGQMEHASIAAFARFNLQLLSLGAPAELIEACHRALSDETTHARLCFGFASRYAGAPLGPGKLEIRDCFGDSDLRAILKLVLREGCLGETVAALEALQAAALTTDRAVKGALLRIACDEQAHAELAFKFLRWGLAECSPEARAELAEDAEQVLAEYERAALERACIPGDRALEGHGVLAGETLRAVHLGALREVVRPLLAALLPDAQGSRNLAQRPPRHCADSGVVATTE